MSSEAGGGDLGMDREMGPRPCPRVVSEPPSQPSGDLHQFTKANVQRICITKSGLLNELSDPHRSRRVLCSCVKCKAGWGGRALGKQSLRQPLHLHEKLSWQGKE